MNEPTIRRIAEEDVQSLINLRLEALHSDPVGFSADYKSDKERPIVEWQERIRSNPIFIAFDEKTATGMAGLYRGSSSKTSHHGVVWGVYVRASHRGRGLCGRLVTTCVDWARENGLRVAYIATAATNTAAIRCYARCGFSVYGLQPMALCVDHTYYDELLMAQQLR